MKPNLMHGQDLIAKFSQVFGNSDTEIRIFHAPGRVNIIGEHIDYNGGYVLPCAIDRGTYALIRKREDKKTRFVSTRFNSPVEISLDNVAYDKSHDWANFPKGIVYYIQQDGHNISGFDILFSGNIPGGGLSSSASIELVTATAINTVFSLGYEMIGLVKMAQKSENEFCGVNCGIMDQFAVGMGKKDYAIYLHCDTLEYKYVPLVLGDYQIIIMDTNKPRQLNESKYNERRAECEQALAIISKAHPINQLTDLEPEVYATLEHLIQDDIIRKRARHVVHENYRVRQAVLTLESGDIITLGKLLQESHASLRDDYEVSCFELDTIVEEALKLPSCLGARLTGAGFGGCAIAIVKKDDIGRFIESVSANYEKTVGYASGMYVCESGDGAREIK